VVRENGTIINGHKRVAAAEIAGLEQLPVEMISVTDQQAADLFRIAHRDGDDDDGEVGRTTKDSGDTTDKTDSAETDSAASRDPQEADQDDDDDDDSGVVFGYDH
jgi:ParB family chromosome partitioning protein